MISRKNHAISQLLLGAITACLPVQLLRAAPIPVSGTGTYAQDFDTLEIEGDNITWTDDSTIEGWYSSRETYNATDGGTFSGSLYSYGAVDSTERALGNQGSGSTDTIYFGVLFQNTSDSPVEIDSVSFTGEQWRASNAAAQSMEFGFLTDSEPITDVINGTWQGVPALNFTSPVFSGETSNLDGNNEANQAALSSTVQIIIPPGEYAMLRWEDINHSGSDHGHAIDDLSVSWKPSTGEDIVPPEVTNLFPAADAEDQLVSAVTELTLLFNEDIALGTGNILIKRTSDMATVLTIDAAADEDFFVFDNEGLILLPEPSPFQKGETYYVEIPSEAITDLASNPFAGFTTPTDWSFSFAEDAEPPIVVINKYANNEETVEVLVIGDETPGSTVDMRGMIIKDFSGSMNGDGGGKFELTTDTLWSAVPVGTLVELINDASSSSDIDASDFTLSIGLADPLYSTSLGGSFDPSNTEMIMIKEAGSGAAGTTGGIHTLAGGEAGDFFTNFPGNKLIAPTGGSGVIALNSTSTLGDFNGLDAEGGATFSANSFGNPNNGTNSAYIALLRGLNPGDGDGAAIVINSTELSPFNGLAMFDKGQPDQSATFSIETTVPGATVTTVEIVVPVELGVPILENITLSGPATDGAALGLDGQAITVTDASVTESAALSVKVEGLSTPTPTLESDNGNYVFTTSTSTSGGVLTPLAQSPAAHVIIPIASIRDTDENGVPLDLGTIVAVEGVATEPDFGSGASNFSGFLQDSTAGVNLFSPVENPSLIRGNRYAVVGPLAQFNGLTEVIPASLADIVDRGVATEPSPLAISVTDLLASAETLEGSLVTVSGLSRAGFETDDWVNGSNITLQDSEMNNITIRIQAGSTATTEPTYPATITGIVGQFDTSSPYFGGYQLMPRDEADVIGSGGDAYTSWAVLNGLTTGVNDGPEQDVENGLTGDGIANVLEFILGGDPLVSDPEILPLASVDEDNFLFVFGRTNESEGITSQTFQWSTDLEFPNANDVVIGSASSGPDANGVTVTISEGTEADLISVSVPRTNAANGKIFGRLLGSRP